MGDCTVDWSRVNAEMDKKDTSSARAAAKYAQSQVNSVRKSIEGLDDRLDRLFEIVRNCSPKGDEPPLQPKGNDHDWSQSNTAMDAKDRAWESTSKQHAANLFSEIKPAVAELRGNVNALYRIIHFSNLGDIEGKEPKGGGDDHNWSQETGAMDKKDTATLKRVKDYADSLERELSTEVVEIISKIDGMEVITRRWCDPE